MRWTWMIAAAMAVLGCKDEARPPGAASPSPAPTATKEPTPAPTPSPPPSAAPSAAPLPRLDPREMGSAFDGEIEDKDWAVNTERAIKTLAPELTDVDCKQQQCRATVNAGSEAELVAKVEQLTSEKGLRGMPDAKHVLLTQAKTADGKTSMQIYVQYER